MRLFLDTNILIDLIADREPFSTAARKLCVASVFGDVQLWVSVQSYCDVFNILSKDYSATAVKQSLGATLRFCLPCGIYAADLRPAFESDWPDIEDYLIAHAATHAKADYFITRDEDLAKRSPLPSMDAGQMINYLADVEGLNYDEIDI